MADTVTIIVPRLMLYSDAVQVANPLGGGKHKMFMLYMTLGKIRTEVPT
jgi:hypothetical protein